MAGNPICHPQWSGIRYSHPDIRGALHTFFSSYPFPFWLSYTTQIITGHFLNNKRLSWRWSHLPKIPTRCTQRLLLAWWKTQWANFDCIRWGFSHSTSRFFFLTQYACLPCTVLEINGFEALEKWCKMRRKERQCAAWMAHLKSLLPLHCISDFWKTRNPLSNPIEKPIA